MTLDQIANLIGTLILLVSGVSALFLPRLYAQVFALNVEKRGTAEIRINFGAFWTGLAIAALALNSESVYTVLAAGWAAIVIVRLLAYFIDRPENMRFYWLLLLGEIITTILLAV
jgi:hypothetical protein